MLSNSEEVSYYSELGALLTEYIPGVDGGHTADVGFTVEAVFCHGYEYHVLVLQWMMNHEINVWEHGPGDHKYSLWFIVDDFTDPAILTQVMKDSERSPLVVAATTVDSWKELGAQLVKKWNQS